MVDNDQQNQTISADDNGKVPYLEAKESLRRCVESLRNDSEPDLDRLIPLVDEALAAYKVCKSRIDTVRLLLSERLGTPQDSLDSEQT